MEMTQTSYAWELGYVEAKIIDRRRTRTSSNWTIPRMLLLSPVIFFFHYQNRERFVITAFMYLTRFSRNIAAVGTISLKNVLAHHLPVSSWSIPEFVKHGFIWTIILTAYVIFL